MTPRDRMRTLAVLALGAVMLPLAFSPAFAQTFSDVKSSPYKEAINALQGAGVVEGYEDGSFKPSSSINRAEFLKIVLIARSSTGGYPKEFNCFPDVKEQWFAEFVCQAKNEGIVAGYPDGRFRPEQTINFVEAAKILSLAYGQDISAYSVDWYEPYARALESSKAIPTSIERLESDVSREEMAEMMWRLSENVTDQPAKGYINVKYPEVAVNMASDTPQTAKSCVDLRAFAEEASRSGYGYGGGVVPMMDTMGEPAPTAARAEESQGANKALSDDDYSGTNVQVEGVDEGDIVKTDGNYLYILTEGKVRIVNTGNLNELAVIEEKNFTPSDLYIEGNRLVILGSSWDNDGDYYIMEKRMAESMIWPGPSYNTQKSEVKIYNVSDRSNPKIERTVSLEGYTVSSRKIEDKLYLIVNQPVQYWGGPIPLTRAATEDDLLPKFDDTGTGAEDEAVTRCDGVTILPRVPSPQYLTVGVIPLNNPKSDVQMEVILGNAQNVYASLENLYVANMEWIYNWSGRDSGAGDNEKTNVYRFAFDGAGIKHEAQGSVPGHILNQFSMDEHENNFRIATTRSRYTNGDYHQDNNLYILNSEMNQVGEIEEIAPGEQIYSVRFVGDRAYMVTYRTVDPFFVIDTSDPRNPEILGQLKIPGYSNYLHPYDENHIIGFGKDAQVSKTGDFAWYQGMKMAIFDVTDVKNPEELHNEAIGDRGTDSPLLSNHKALLFDKERGLLAFPVRIHELTEAQKKGPESDMAYGEPTFQGAYVYDISLRNGFDLRGKITHYNEQDYLKSGSYYYGKDVERIVRVGESLYTISMNGVQKHDEDTVRLQSTMVFEDKELEASCYANDPDVNWISKDPQTCETVRFTCADGQEAFHNECGCGCS